MGGKGPFLWIWEHGPEAGFWQAPQGGLCLSSFLFLRRGHQILLGKYKDVPDWERLTGLNEEFRRRFGNGWTIPASHLKYGEDPRDAARRVGEEVLGLPGLTYSEPRVEVDFYPHPSYPGTPHYDIWFLVNAQVSPNYKVKSPAWYADLAWHDPLTLPPSAYARGHEDVVARWLKVRGPSRTTHGRSPAVRSSARGP